MRPRRRFAVMVVLTVAVALVPSTATATGLQASDVEIGGRSMHLDCVGEQDPSRPSVIAEAGYGGTSTDFLDLLALLDEASIHACAYDRAGLGLSDPGPEPSDLADGAEDLHALLASAGIEPPYVMVPHSMGAWYARYFTHRYPDEVAAIVFVDPRHPDADARFRAVLPPPSAGEHPVITDWRRGTLPPDPRLDLASMTEQMGTVGDLGDRPVVVLTQDWDYEPSGLPSPYEERAGAAWRVMTMEHASLSTRGIQRDVPDAGHYIQMQRPEVVFEAINEVLAASEAVSAARPSPRDDPPE